LLLRWMEMNTFSPVFRTHEGNLPDASLQVYSDSETAKAFSYWAKQFADLFEYRKQVIKDAAEQGWPAVRPLWFEHPSCGLCYEIDDQFFFGDRYLVAPVLRPGVRSRRVYLPNGTWKRLYSKEAGKIYTGDRWIKAKAPLGEPAVFLRQN
jgi:alpha-glucosidase